MAQGRETLIISESGLYTLILRCRGAMRKGTVAHTFRKWVTSEVLPALRRTGTYTAQPAAAAPPPPVEKADVCLTDTSQIINALNIMAGSILNLNHRVAQLEAANAPQGSPEITYLLRYLSKQYPYACPVNHAGMVASLLCTGIEPARRAILIHNSTR